VIGPRQSRTNRLTSAIGQHHRRVISEHRVAYRRFYTHARVSPPRRPPGYKRREVLRALAIVHADGVDQIDQKVKTMAGKNSLALPIGLHAPRSTPPGVWSDCFEGAATLNCCRY